MDEVIDLVSVDDESLEGEGIVQRVPVVIELLYSDDDSMSVDIYEYDDLSSDDDSISMVMAVLGNVLQTAGEETSEQ